MVQKPTRPAGKPVWLLLVGIVGASALIWALVPTATRRQADPDGESAASQEAMPAAPAAHGREADLSRLRRAIEVLSQAHADLAGSERRGAMNDLLSQGDAPTKLTMLLEAVAGDPTEPDRDPLWPELVQGLSSVWQGDGIGSGIDLMFTESRPRARDAVVSSFAKLALERPGELTAAQRQKLIESFIDLHNRLPGLQQREVEAATRRIGGNDVADLMQGKGMASDEELEVQRDYKRSLQDNQRVATQ
ncbi:MAG TPA: hypothetical protein VIF57_26800 [Polyangia bacterium]